MENASAVTGNCYLETQPYVLAAPFPALCSVLPIFPGKGLPLKFQVSADKGAELRKLCTLLGPYGPHLVFHFHFLFVLDLSPSPVQEANAL